MTRELASIIKALRCQGYTHRAIARNTHVAFPDECSLPSTQLTGEQLVEDAANLLGERPGDWDDYGVSALRRDVSPFVGVHSVCVSCNALVADGNLCPICASCG